MERAFAKLVRLLALTSWSEKELHEIIRAASNITPNMFLELVKAAREELSDDLPRGVRERSRSRSYDPALDKAYDLLMELPVNTTLAARKLRRIIAGHQPGAPVRVMRPKEGVRVWLEHVADIVGTSELLHFCNLLREQLVDTDRGPWSSRSDTDN